MSLPTANAKDPKDFRAKAYAKLRIGKEQLDMDDEFYYGIWLPMRGATLKDGRYSASTLSVAQLGQAVQEMERLGAKFTAAGKKFQHTNKDWRAERIGKITALWCALADAGAVKDRSREAMEKWCKRYTTKDRLQWARSEDLNACIENLKQWAKRAGVTLA